MHIVHATRITTKRCIKLRGVDNLKAHRHECLSSVSAYAVESHLQWVVITATCYLIKDSYAILQLRIQKIQPRSHDGATVCRRLSCMLSAISQHTAEERGRVSTSLLRQRDSRASTSILIQMNFTVVYVPNIFKRVRKISKSD